MKTGLTVKGKGQRSKQKHTDLLLELVDHKPGTNHHNSPADETPQWLNGNRSAAATPGATPKASAGIRSPRSARCGAELKVILAFLLVSVLSNFSWGHSHLN